MVACISDTRATVALLPAVADCSAACSWVFSFCNLRLNVFMPVCVVDVYACVHEVQLPAMVADCGADCSWAFSFRSYRLV